MQLTIGYRGSSLSIDRRDESAGVRAGDRFPDVPDLVTTDGPRRLFDLTRGGRFTVLSFGDAAVDGIPPVSATVHRIVERPSAPDEVGDPDGALAAAFEVDQRALVVLRPDGYIGAIDDGGAVGTVADYLSRFERRTTGARS